VSNKIEEIKRGKDGPDVLDDIYRYARLGFDAIPPDDYERMKWYGLFHRSQTPGFFMMRLRIPNGILTSPQTRQLGEIVNRFGRGTADITTRQNVQFRWLRIEDVREIFALLKNVGRRAPAVWHGQRAQRHRLPNGGNPPLTSFWMPGPLPLPSSRQSWD
jgi:ferredoxin-nitrite reductase